MEKKPISLDWEKLMPQTKDDEAPPEIVVAGEKTPAKGNPEFAGKGDEWVIDNLKRNKSHVANIRNLPDNGFKLKARIKLLEDELEYRKLHPKNDDGHEKLTQLKRPKFTSALNDFMETTPPRSGISESFSRKMDGNRTESRTVKAFESEFSFIGHGGNRNAKFNEKSSTREQQKSMMSSKQSPYRCATKLSADADLRKTSVRDQKQPLLKQSSLWESNKLSTDADQRYIYNGGQKRQSSTTLSQKSNENSFMKKRLSQSLPSKDSRLRNGNSFSLIDEDSDPELEIIECMEQSDEVDDWFDERMKDCKIYYPSRDDPDSLEICYSDMCCLAPQTFLSSTIMNFYIRHLQQPTSARGRQSSEYHFFNTYFYSKFTEAVSKNEMETSFPRLRRWWKGVDIFKKAYILLPVHENLHWSLVIICIPDKKDSFGPIILHLDSLEAHSSSSIFENVKTFLREEWKHLNQGDAPPDVPVSDRIWKYLPDRIDVKRIEVPQQKNDYDCGLFVLYFMELFLLEAPERLQMNDLARFGRKWFKPEAASSLRQKIRKLLKEEFRKESEDGVPAQSTTVVAQEQKLEQPIDITKFVLVETEYF